MLRTAVFLLMIGVAAAGTAAFLKDSPPSDDVETLKTFPAGGDGVHDSGDNEDAEYIDGDSGGGVPVPDCGSDLFCRQPANYPADRMAALIARNAAMVAQFIPAVPMALRYSMSIPCL
jgi:hypothetical protein